MKSGAREEFESWIALLGLPALSVSFEQQTEQQNKAIRTNSLSEKPPLQRKLNYGANRIALSKSSIFGKSSGLTLLCVERQRIMPCLSTMKKDTLGNLPKSNTL